MAKKKRILLVDDSSTGLLVQHTMLATSGYEVVTAKSGIEALKKAETERPDLVLLDVLMPGMDGFEVCRKLRELPATRLVPILLVSTRVDQAAKDSGREAGCTDYIPRPFTGDEMMARIKSHLAT